MKRSIKILILILLSIILISCEKQKCKELYPKGFGLISSDYAAIASLEYNSCSTFNVNQLTLEKFRLPNLWAKVDSSILVNVETVETSDGIFYAKYLNIGSKIFTAEVAGNKVKYQSTDINDLYTWLEIEDNVKWYCEQVKLGKVYFNAADGAKQEILINELISHRIQINWSEENDSLPNFSDYFIEFDSKLINQIFNRAYSSIETNTP